MRTAPVVALALLILPAVARAQAGVEFSIKGGLSFGDVTNKGLLPGNLKSRTGFAAGAGLASRGLVGIGIEGLIAQRGVTSETSTNERKLNYLDVPLYLRVAIPVPGLRPFAYAGPQASFELSCKVEELDCPDDDRESTDFAGVIGAGLKMGLLAGLLIEARYIYGLRDLKLSTLIDDESYKTRSFMILAGIAF